MPEDTRSRPFLDCREQAAKRLEHTRRQHAKRPGAPRILSKRRYSTRSHPEGPRDARVGLGREEVAHEAAPVRAHSHDERRAPPRGSELVMARDAGHTSNRHHNNCHCTM